MSRFRTCYSTFIVEGKPIAPPDDPRLGWRVAWGSEFLLGTRFARERDAQAAIENMEKHGITPDYLSTLDNDNKDAWFEVSRICAEALQW